MNGLGDSSCPFLVLLGLVHEQFFSKSWRKRKASCYQSSVAYHVGRCFPLHECSNFNQMSTLTSVCVQTGSLSIYYFRGWIKKMTSAEITTIINSRCHQCIYSNTNSDAVLVTAYKNLCRSVNLTLNLAALFLSFHPHYPAIHPRVLELVAQ